MHASLGHPMRFNLDRLCFFSYCAAKGIAFLLVCGVLVALALLFIYKCTKMCLNIPSPRARPVVQYYRVVQYRVVPDHVIRHTSIERFLAKMAKENHPIRFTAEQLTGYTGNYSAQLGRGGFGTVYRGVLPNGLAVAVKVLHDPRTSEEQFKAEMGTIGTTHHVNLVRLYGYCFQGDTHALVYEFMEHGALNAYLSAHGAGVSMATVAEIATGVARGLRYLHEECQRKIVHYDIKPDNVLLDATLTPKVADFGLARLVSRADTHDSVSRPRGGTPGFGAPEVWRELRVTEKCDVYSFGMLLLDIVCRGRNLLVVDADAASDGSQQWFPMVAWTKYQGGELMELLAPTADRHRDDEPWRCRELVERLCKVAFWCVQERPPARPFMSAVVKMLEGEMNIAPPPYPFNHLFGPPSAMASSLNTMPS
uniref:Uncharacterized protein n=1 Tax=Avena sativa TaxID=4498 RepID=A0ACD5TZH4_AVESA